MLNSSVDEEAPKVFALSVTNHDESYSCDNKKMTTSHIAMKIIKISLIACMSLFLLIWSVIGFQAFDGKPVTSIREPHALLIFATLCYCGASTFDVALRTMKDGIANIGFGFLGAALFWLISAIILQLTYNKLSFSNTPPVLWMVGSVINISILVFECIKLCKSKEKSNSENGRKRNLIFIIFAIAANAFFLGANAWELVNINKDWPAVVPGIPSDDHHPGNPGNFPQQPGDNLPPPSLYPPSLSPPSLSPPSFGYGGIPLGDMNNRHLDSAHGNDINDLVDDVLGGVLFIHPSFSKNMKGVMGLYIGGSLMYIIHSILTIVAMAWVGFDAIG